jgi:hypothetical protein
MVLELKEDLILYFEFELGNVVLLRGMRMDSMKLSKCLFKMLTIKERHKITHLCT